MRSRGVEPNQNQYALIVSYGGLVAAAEFLVDDKVNKPSSCFWLRVSLVCSLSLSLPSGAGVSDESHFGLQEAWGCV